MNKQTSRMPVSGLRRAACVLTAAVGMLLCQAPAPAPAAEPMRIIVAQSGQGLSYTPFYIAQEKNFFVEEGLEVVTADIAGIQQLVALGNNEANLSPGTAFSIISTAKGRPMVTIAAAVIQNAVDLVVSNAALARANVRPTDPIADRIRAMRGLKLGISSLGSGTDAFVRYILPRYGLQPDRDVTLVTLGSCVAMLAALQNGSVDGFLCAPPAPQQAEASGLGQVLISGTAGEVPDVRNTLYLGYFAKPEYIQQNPATIQAFVNGLTRGLRYIRTNPEEAAAIAAKYQPGLDPSVFDKIFKLFLHAFPETAVTDVEGLRRYIEVVRTTNPGLQDVDANALVDNSFAERAARNIR